MLSIHKEDSDDTVAVDSLVEQPIPFASEDIQLLNGIIARYDAILVEIDTLNACIEESLVSETKAKAVEV